MKRKVTITTTTVNNADGSTTTTTERTVRYWAPQRILHAIPLTIAAAPLPMNNMNSDVSRVVCNYTHAPVICSVLMSRCAL